MEKYSLLGTYDTRNNVEVIYISESFEDLEKIQKAIKVVNRLLKDKDREYPDNVVCELVNEFMSGIDIIDDTTGYVHEIDPIGIYELKPADREITVSCVKCKKVLFEGSEKERDRMIIYCTDCAENNRGDVNE